MFGHLCVGVAVGDDALDGEDVDDVVDAGVDDPPVDASATPVAPAPTPAASTPVMIIRLTRLPVLDTIRFPPSGTPRGPLPGPRSASLCGARPPASRTGALSAL
jgi:hypothetical protein